MAGESEKEKLPETSSSGGGTPAGTTQPPAAVVDPAKWGTQVMGQPAAPGSHPDNSKAASWITEEDQQSSYYNQNYQQQHHPYLMYSPVVDKPNDNPFESVVHMFNSWSHKAETIARNIWHNRMFSL